MKRLLVLCLLAAAVAAPAAVAAKSPITVAKTSATGDRVEIVRVFRKVIPRAIDAVATGSVGYISTKTSCYDSVNSSWPDVNRGSTFGPGRYGLMYDRDSYYCTVTVSASPATTSGTVKLALQIVR